MCVSLKNKLIFLSYTQINRINRDREVNRVMHEVDRVKTKLRDRQIGSERKRVSDRGREVTKET